MALEHLLSLRKGGADFDFLVDASLRWLSGFMWLSAPENITRFKAALRANPNLQSIVDQERQLAALKTFNAGLGNMPWPHGALVVSATDDFLTPPREGQALAKSLGESYMELPGGHPSPLEEPERLLRGLMTFLS